MSNISLIDGHIDNAEHCVCCGAVIPEGRQVCIICGLKTNYKQSTADVVEVVRCKDCVYCCISTDPKTHISIQKCGYVGFNPVQSSQVSDDFYCSHGERKDKKD